MSAKVKPKRERVLTKMIGLTIDQERWAKYKDLNEFGEGAEGAREVLCPWIDAEWERVFGKKRSDAS